jgi:hypothetical protein
VGRVDRSFQTDARAKPARPDAGAASGAYSQAGFLPIFFFVHRTLYPWRPLGQLLVDAGLVTAFELEQALAEQQRTGRRLGEILVAHGAVSGPELTRVLAEQSGIELTLATEPERRLPEREPAQVEARAWRPLGSLLVERGALSDEQLSQALREQRANGRRLGEILVGRGFVTPLDLVAAVIDQHGLERTTEPDDFVSVSLASRAQEVYEVEAEDAPGHATVVFRAPGFLDATDFAFELLDAESPSWLRIFRLRNGEREEVWAYDESRAAEAAAAPDLVQVYGFDPARWTGPRL